MENEDIKLSQETFKELSENFAKVSLALGIEEKDDVFVRTICDFIGKNILSIVDAIQAELGCSYDYALALATASCTYQSLLMSTAIEMRKEKNNGISNT